MATDLLAYAPQAATGILPVFVFLAGLVFIDSFKLVPASSVLGSVAAGACAALIAYPLQTWLIGVLDLQLAAYSRYGAPIIEEALKAAVVIALLRMNRIGFLVDAAIYGFAVGAGFALLENLYYLQNNLAFGVWIIRGFGTAVMHGGMTAIFAVVSKTLTDRKSSHSVPLMLPGLFLAAAMHSMFNHFVLPPIMMVVVLMTVLPIVFLIVFHQSERMTRSWLGSGFDSDQELLRQMLSDEWSRSRTGMYLASLKGRFPGQIVADMLCYLRLYVELSIRAKGILMMRESGFEVAPDPTIRGKFAEMEYLKKSIGPTGLLAISPFLHRSSRDLWQLNALSRGLG